MTVLYTPTPMPPPKPAGPKSPAERAQALIDVVERLGGLITEEDQALAQAQLRHLGKTAPRKQKLGFAFDELCRLLRVDRQALLGLDDDTKQELRLAIGRMRAAARDQEKRLRTKTEAHRHLVESLVKTTNHERRTEQHYAKGLGLAPPIKGGTAPSTAFNVQI